MKKDKNYIKKIELINHIFRTERELARTMLLEFPIIMDKKNSENMLSKDIDSMPVSVLNILFMNVKSSDIKFKIAALGQVGTLKEHRKKGYSGEVLEKALIKIKEENAAFTVVSSTKNHYKKRGFIEIDSLKIKPRKTRKTKKIKFEKLRVFDILKQEQNFRSFVKAYKSTKTSIENNKKNIRKLLKARLFEKKNIEYEILKTNSEKPLYIILEVHNNKTAKVIDIYSENLEVDFQIIVDSILEIYSEIDFFTYMQKSIVKSIDSKYLEREKLPHMIKITNYNSLEKFLQEAFKDKDIKIKKQNSKVFFTYLGKEKEYDEKEFTKLIFEPSDLNYSIFPIELPFLEGLNYQ